MKATLDSDITKAARQIAEAELSLWPRVAHGALLMAALAMTIIVAALWLTEPDLPLRTRAALAVLAVIGATWISYASWVLTQRRVLFARQRVVGGWLALAFTSLFTAGAFAMGILAEAAAGLAAGGLGLGLVAISALLLARARRRLSALLDRRHALEAMRGESAL